jgi:SAM-dependent methyltransferase
VTAHISTDLAAVPLLWVLPLALYLLTFVIAFSQRSPARHAWWLTVTPPLILATLITIALNATAWWFMPLHVVAFFSCAMACHRELAGTRPHVTHLTEFYLWISFGGMLGGVFNTLVAPHVFSTVLEYPLVLALIGFLVPAASKLSATSRKPVALGYVLVLASVAMWVLGQPSEQTVRILFAATFGTSVALGIACGSVAFRLFSLLVASIIFWGPPPAGGTLLFSARSFFGVMRVLEAPDQSYRTLRHGSTTHGWQRLPAEGRCEPSSYYHPGGPIGDAMKAFGARLNDVALVGLGTGAMACYAAPGQQWTFFEIDPLVERIARDPSLFSHLQNAEGNVEVVIGDGRIKLQEQAPGRFDMIVVDAFSSDSIPVHLLTQEALQLYASRLRPDGILAIHVSNRYLALEPVVAALAAQEGLFAIAKYEPVIPVEAGQQGMLAAHWMVLSRDSDVITVLADGWEWRAPAAGARSAIWTDDYSNIFKALR